jgi:hypothetical protein
LARSLDGERVFQKPRLGQPTEWEKIFASYSPTGNYYPEYMKNSKIKHQRISNPINK